MGLIDDLVPDVEGFEWDAGNSDKNWLQHGVRQADAEQAFLNRPLTLAADVKHSKQEPRLLAFGRTDAGKQLALVFTVRHRRIRVISARSMSRAERKVYAHAEAKPETNP
jgi:uncharacterized DUF497 family protein